MKDYRDYLDPAFVWSISTRADMLRRLFISRAISISEAQSLLVVLSEGLERELMSKLPAEILNSVSPTVARKTLGAILRADLSVETGIFLTNDQKEGIRNRAYQLSEELLTTVHPSKMWYKMQQRLMRFASRRYISSTLPKSEILRPKYTGFGVQRAQAKHVQRMRMREELEETSGGHPTMESGMMDTTDKKTSSSTISEATGVHLPGCLDCATDTLSEFLSKETLPTGYQEGSGSPVAADGTICGERLEKESSNCVEE